MKVSLSLSDQVTTEVEFEELLKEHKQTLVYFYPRDNTPGCTIEAKDFSENYGTFLKNDIGVYGISKDGDASHCDFIKQHSLSIPLISDPQGVLHKKYNSYKQKPLSGGKILGTITNALGVTRSTFLLDPDGNVLQEWRNVSAIHHVKDIMMALGFC